MLPHESPTRHFHVFPCKLEARSTVRVPRVLVKKCKSIYRPPLAIQRPFLDSPKCLDSKYAENHRSTPHFEFNWMRAEEICVVLEPESREHGRPSTSGSSTSLAGEQRLLERELSVLRSIPGCTGVGASTYSGAELNRMDVRVKKPGEATGKVMRKNCNADLDTKLKAALALKTVVAMMLGEELVQRAERQVDGIGDNDKPQREPPDPEPIGPSAAELEWLAEWLDLLPKESGSGHGRAGGVLYVCHSSSMPAPTWSHRCL